MPDGTWLSNMVSVLATGPPGRVNRAAPARTQSPIIVNVHENQYK
jgi:hypothetical protein